MDLKIIESELCNFIKENLVAENIDILPETDLAVLGLDSFSLIEIVLFLERKFEIELPDEVLTTENVRTAKNISACAFAESQKN